MRTIFMTIIMVALVIGGFRYFLASDSTGLYKDTKTIRDKKDIVINENLAPPP